MSNEAYAFALENALTEIRNVCPDVQSSFLFDKDANVVAGDTKTPEAKIESLVNSLEGILDKVDTIGGLNSLKVEASKGSVHISCIDELYLAMTVSKGADMKYLETVARVLIPTVIKLLNSLGSTPIKQLPPSPLLREPKEEEEPKEEIKQEHKKKKADKEEPISESELPSNQLIAESFGGLFVRGDTVHISEETMSRWEELLDGKEIKMVEIEAFNGQSTQCKVKALDNTKMENKAVVRIPEKICQTLDVKKGELVRVKPVIT